MHLITVLNCTGVSLVPLTAPAFSSQTHSVVTEIILGYYDHFKLPINLLFFSIEILKISTTTVQIES